MPENREAKRVNDPAHVNCVFRREILVIYQFLGGFLELCHTQQYYHSVRLIWNSSRILLPSALAGVEELPHSAMSFLKKHTGEGPGIPTLPGRAVLACPAKMFEGQAGLMAKLEGEAIDD